MGKKIFILGAAGPEMDGLDAALSQRGHTVAYATVGLGGERVSPSTAYKADGTSHYIGDLAGDIIFIECNVAGLTPAMVISIRDAAQLFGAET